MPKSKATPIAAVKTVPVEKVDSLRKTSAQRLTVLNGHINSLEKSGVKPTVVKALRGKAEALQGALTKAIDSIKVA